MPSFQDSKLQVGCIGNWVVHQNQGQGPKFGTFFLLKTAEQETYMNTLSIENAALIYLVHLHLSRMTRDTDIIYITMAILHLVGQFVIL